MKTRSNAFSLDAKYFLAFVVAGIGAMVLLKLLGVGQLWVTIVVAGMVVAYAFAVVHFGRLHLRLDQAGDNAYYLGLVYTLCSMAWALIEVSAALKAAGAARNTAEIVIGNFGLALMSTLVGIVCRIVLHQMRLDPADVEKESRLQLASASSKMVATLTDVESQFGRFMHDAQQRHRDHIDEISKSHEELRQQVQESMRDSVQQVRESLSSATAILAESVQKMASATDTETHALALAAERLGAVEPPPARLNKRFGELATQVESLDRSLAEINENLSGTASALLEGAAAVQQASQGLVGLGLGLGNKLDEQQRLVTTEIGSVRESVSSLNAALESVSSSASRLAEDAKESRAAVNIVQGSAIEAVQRLTAVVEKVDTSLASKSAPVE